MIPYKHTKIKDWYKVTYPADLYGCFELKSDITFEGAYIALIEGRDIYDYLGVDDSIVRERVFIALSEIMQCEYDTIYYMWLNS